MDNMKTFFIVGAQFDNKGAQSMLFVTVDELRKAYPDCKIYCACTEWIDSQVYNFDCIYYSDREKNIALRKNTLRNYIEAILKDAVKVVIGRYNNFMKYKRLDEVLRKTNLIIDVSGYNIGDKWDIATHESYFNNIRLANKYGIPMVLLPQSFGPFNYKNNQEYLISQISKLLVYPSIVFAREKEGYDFLIDLGLTNVELTTDLVLQNTGLCAKNILKQKLELNIPEINTKNNVGIIPNSQCFEHGDKDRILVMYKMIIEKLLAAGKEIYIFRHSREDLNVCQIVYDLADKNNKVHLIENDFSCLEYDEWIKKFDYIIASRFHAIVHAYRGLIPCILLGWAVKYKELSSKLGQEGYSFDITSDSFDEQEVMRAVNKLDENYKMESNNIKLKLEDIQKSNCFNILFGMGIVK